MQNLIVLFKSPKTEQLLPFSIYTSPKEQSLLNVPVVKPLLIAVLGGNKQLGKDDEEVKMVGNYNNFQVKVLNQKALKLMHQLT